MPSQDQGPEVIDDGAAATEHGSCEDDGAATEHIDASALPLDLLAEFLMGVQEGGAQAQDPIDLLVVFQKNLELVQEAGMRLYKLEERRVQAKGTEVAADAATALTAVKGKHGDAPVHWSRWCDCRHHQCPCAIRQTAAHERPTHDIAEESATEHFLVDSRRSTWTLLAPAS